MKLALQTLNELESEGLIQSHAIGGAMAIYHLWIIGGGPLVEQVVQLTGYDLRAGFPWLWVGPPSAIIYRGPRDCSIRSSQ